LFTCRCQRLEYRPCRKIHYRYCRRRRNQPRSNFQILTCRYILGSGQLKCGSLQGETADNCSFAGVVLSVAVYCHRLRALPAPMLVFVLFKCVSGGAFLGGVRKLADYCGGRVGGAHFACPPEILSRTKLPRPELRGRGRGVNCQGSDQPGRWARVGANRTCLEVACNCQVLLSIECNSHATSSRT